MIESLDGKAAERLEAELEKVGVSLDSVAGMAALGLNVTHLLSNPEIAIAAVIGGQFKGMVEELARVIAMLSAKAGSTKEEVVATSHIIHEVVKKLKEEAEEPSGIIH